MHRDVVARTFALVRSVDASGIAPAALHDAVDAASAAIAEVLALEQSLLLQERAGILFCNGVKLRPDFRVLAAAEGLGGYFRRANVAGILFEEGLTAAELHEVARWLGRGMTAPPDWPHVHWIEQWDEPPGETTHGRERSTYMRKLYFVQRFLDALAGASELDRRSQREAVSVLVDALLDDPASMATVTVLQAEPEDCFATAVRRSVLAVWFGKSLGLDGEVLDRAGTTALFDTGASPLDPQVTEIVTLVGAWLRIADVVGVDLDARRAAFRKECQAALLPGDLVAAFERQAGSFRV